MVPDLHCCRPLDIMEATEIAGLHATSDSTDESLEHGLALTPFHIFVTFLSTLTVLLILLLNPLMLFILRRVTSIQPTTKIFMASLTLSDLCSGVCWILRVVEMLARSWIFGEFLCMVGGVAALIFDSLGIWSLLLLTIDRYISITRPLRYHSVMTELKSKITVCTAWVVLFLTFIFMYGIYDRATVSQDGPYQLCVGVKNDWRIYLIVALTVISLATIFILYAHIILIARNQARRIAAENQAGNGQGGERINTRSTTTIIIITGTLIITWMPAVTVFVITPNSEWKIYDRYMVIMLAQALLLSNGWLNIVIYYLRNSDLRQSLHCLLSDWHQCLTQRFLH